MTTTMPVHGYLEVPDIAGESQRTIYMSVPDIAGESTLIGYEDWLHVDRVSASWVLDDAGETVRGRRRGTITPGRIIVQLPFGRGGVYLVEAALRGRTFREVLLHHVQVVQDGEVHPVLQQEFDKVTIVAARSDSLGGIPTLQLELSYAALRMLWTEPDPSGGHGAEHEVTYDVTRGV